MTDTEKKEDHSPQPFVKLLVSVIGALGGFTAAFVVLGYVIVQSFISTVRLYGLVDFPIQFYKEAAISFMKDIMDFYTLRPYLIASTLFIVFVPLLTLNLSNSRKPKKGLFQKYFPVARKYLSVIYIFSVIVLTLKLGIIQQGLWGFSGITARQVKDIVLYSFSVPTLFSILIYLAYNFSDFKPHKLVKTNYGLSLLFLLLLFMAVPIGYGSTLYDIPLHRVKAIECKEDPAALKKAPTEEFKIFYLLGHTSSRELFFDASTNPAGPILVDKALIKTIALIDDPKPMTLRRLFEKADDIIQSDKKVKTEIITKEEKEWSLYVK